MCYLPSICVYSFNKKPAQYREVVKGKAVPLQSWSGPEGSRKLRFPYFMTTAQDGSKVVSLMHRQHLPPRKYTCYPFLLEAEWTRGPECGGKDYVTEKFQWHQRESNQRPAGLYRSALTTTRPTNLQIQLHNKLQYNVLYTFIRKLINIPVHKVTVRYN
jgi:hypothetical protein